MDMWCPEKPFCNVKVVTYLFTHLTGLTPLIDFPNRGGLTIGINLRSDIPIEIVFLQIILLLDLRHQPDDRPYIFDLHLLRYFLDWFTYELLDSILDCIWAADLTVTHILGSIACYIIFKDRAFSSVVMVRM